jgi:hypothetical protein
VAAEGVELSPVGRVKAVVLGAVLLLLVPVSVAAQELQIWISPELGKQMGRGDYRFTFYPERNIDQGSTLAMKEHRLTLFVPVYQSSRDEITIGGRVTFQDIDTQARLPDLDVPFPEPLWDISGTIAMRHKFDNGWIGAVGMSAGTATDEPFKSWDDVYVRTLAMLRIPRGERDAWILSVLYASDQELFGLKYIPIPGIAYFWNYSERFRAVVGVPFSSIEVKPFEKLKLEAQYFPFWTIRTFATWEIFRPLRAYIGWDFDSDHWVRHGRGDPDDRIYYYEKRATIGARFDLRHFGVEVFGGYAFDRFYFEGEGYSDRYENRIDVRDSPFFVGRLHVRF